jgi:hypothetical protein
MADHCQQHAMEVIRTLKPLFTPLPLVRHNDSLTIDPFRNLTAAVQSSSGPYSSAVAGRIFQIFV